MMPEFSRLNLFFQFVLLVCTADLGKLAKRNACRPPHCSWAMIRGNVNWLLSAATAHEQRDIRFARFPKITVYLLCFSVKLLV